MEPEDGLDLGPFVAATRSELDRAARRRHDAGIPPAPSPPRRGAFVSLLIAAAVVLVGAAVVAATRGDLLSSAVRGPAWEAEHQLGPHAPALVSPHPTAPDRAVHEAGPASYQPSAPQTPVPPTTAAATSDLAPSAEQTRPEPGGSDASAPSSERTAVRPRHSALAELERLDAEAQRRWRAGDLAGAEALFLEIVDQGGRSSYAELAFGDLFTLADQIGDARREQQRWRRYLARFPHGRFADDVRAWQCRRATGPDAIECWHRYLEDWPEGTYRAEADRATSSGGPP
jgi:hypothetical protein